MIDSALVSAGFSFGIGIGLAQFVLIIVGKVLQVISQPRATR